MKIKKLIEENTKCKVCGEKEHQEVEWKEVKYSRR